MGGVNRADDRTGSGTKRRPGGSAANRRSAAIPRPALSWPRPARIALWLAAGLAALLLLLAVFPFAVLKGVAERRLAARIGAPVTIGRIERLDPVSFAPRIRLADVAVGQPAWAGRGALAQIRATEVRVPVLPLLLGRLAVDAVTLEGARLDLVRSADGRESWRLGGSGDGRGGGPSTVIIRDSRLRMTDLGRHMRFEGPIAADAAGLRLDGAGFHRGKPLTIAVRTGPARAGQPLRLTLASPLLRMDARMRLVRPFSIARMEGDVTAAAPDARILDDVIQTGLPGTQPVTLTAHVRRDRRDWHLSPIAGTVGGSRLTATLDITRPGGRVRIDGRVRAGRLDFDDFGSDADRAEGEARRARLGPRIVPFARIDLHKLGNLDGRVALVSPNFVVQGAPMFRTLAATVALDRRRMTIAPLSVGLAHGRAGGRILVDHRDGLPKLTLDLSLRDGSLQELFGSDLMRATVRGRVRVEGRGLDVRAAAARSTGFVAMVAEGGDVRKRMAALAGGDVLDGSDEDERTALRCLIVRMDARPGRVSTGTFLVDTGVSRIDARGSVALPDERLGMVLTGRSKQPDFIRAVPAVRLGGTLSDPKLQFPAVQRKRGFFGKVGAALKVLRIGKQGDVAPDADCRGLAARALAD